ncbi:MAG: LTA synthase family protein, partial [Planctomycetota bacterium]|nr:LTA synthase family protein [Planctomycetota bacterium]
KFEAFYASGQRSIEGIQALLTGVPPMIGHPELAYGLEMSNLTEVGTVAQKHGYKTLFGRTAQRESFRLLTAAQRVGFKHVFGMEDVPRIRDYPTKNPRWGWDYDTLMYGLEELNTLGPPFLGIFFTATTHKPFPDPGPQFHKNPYSPSGKNGFTNSLYYADWALGEFIKKAKQQPWFSNTIFILTADQVGTRYLTRDPSPAKHLRNDFRIPLVLYGPGIIEPGVNREVSSHVDLMPTLFDLLGFQEPFSSIGESVLRKDSGFAIVKQGAVSTIFTKEGALQHSLQNRLNSFAFDDPANVDFNELEKILLSVDQITYELLIKNRWSPPVSH